MAKYNIGDKVRVIDVDSIMYGRFYWDNGDVTEVVDYFAGYPRIRTVKVSGHRLVITDDEFHAIELVEESTDEIEELKRRVSELEVKVKRLESDRRTVELLVDPVKFALEYVDSRKDKTANERHKEANALRAEVIEKAKKFVKETERKAMNNTGIGGNLTYRFASTTPEYVVNEEKRTTVVLARGAFSGILLEKGIAKCNPADTFNVHIGKAIALGRAYGLDVSEFEQAPQPDEVVPGMVVEDIEAPPCKYEVAKIIDDISEIVGYDGEKHGTPFRVKAYSGWLGEKQVRIISDSKAEY